MGKNGKSFTETANCISRNTSPVLKCWTKESIEERLKVVEDLAHIKK